MVQLTKSSNDEIISKLGEIQSDVEDIKEKLKFIDLDILKKELASWEQASSEDTSEFLEKNNL